MATESDVQNAIIECKGNIAKNKLAYPAWHDDAEKRTMRGERQFLCVVCGLWRWKHELCKIAIIEE